MAGDLRSLPKAHLINDVSGASAATIARVHEGIDAWLAVPPAAAQEIEAPLRRVEGSVGQPCP